MRRRRAVAILLSTLVALSAWTAVVTGRAAAAPGWQPEPESYGVSLAQDVPVTMPDGTVLRADIQSPTIAGTSTPAGGPFPVLLAQTPYGRASLNDEMSYFVRRGYVAVSVDVRGTGSSQGSWVPFSPIETADSVTLVHWSAALPGSDGSIGLYGDSYKGINQLTTSAAVGPNSPVKAIFPVVAGNDLYRDLFSMGGLANDEFLPLWLATTGAGTLFNPLQDAVKNGSAQSLSTTLRLELQHAGGIATNLVPLLTSSVAGGPAAYDGDYWQARNPANILAKIVANGIPAFLVGGWNDLFQRGALMNYAGLQNAWAGRPTTAPMLAGQPVTGRYQLLMGPWYHVPGQEVDLPALKLRWYDQWLKNADTGIAATADPLHLNVFGTSNWIDTNNYPFPAATATSQYLAPGRTGTSTRSANDGALTTAAPVGGNTDRITWTPVNSTCTRSTTQWLGGLNLLSANGCQTTDLDREHGIGALVYTSAPVSSSTIIAGPINATIYAQSNTSDTEFVVTLTDVGPDRSSTPVSEGALIGSQRAVDPAKSWYTTDGQLLMPYHPYTAAAKNWVQPNTVTRYDIEIFPTFVQLAPGHRIRVVVTTTDFPHLTPTVAQLRRLLGGIYQVHTGSATPSSITIPLAPASAFTTPCGLCH
jgi:putative CocE/NonD family hydrolase